MKRIILTEQSTTADVFQAIKENDEETARDAGCYRLIGKAAQALAAACEANGLPVNALLPMVEHLATKLVNPRYKKQ